METRQVKVIVKDYEVDFKYLKKKLPKSLILDVSIDIIEDEEELIEFLSEEISNITSYLHHGFTYEII